MEPVLNVSLDDIASPLDVQKLSDEELLLFHLRLHQWDATLREKGAAREYRTINRHVWVVQEMRRRGMNHNEHDELDRDSRPFLDKSAYLSWLERLMEQAGDAVLVPHYVSLVGSAAFSDDPNDIDVLVREDPNVAHHGWRESVLLLARKVLDPEKTGKQLHLLFNPQGPHLAEGQAYVPLFDLVLRPHRPLEPINCSELRPLMRYPVQKPAMVGSTDFFSSGEAWERWAEKAVAEGGVVYASPKVDGFRVVLSRSGDDVRVWLEDTQEPLDGPLARVARELPDGTTVEGELAVLHGERWLARPQIPTFLRGNIDGEPYVFLYDVTVWHGEDVHDWPFSERLELLQSIDAPHAVVLPQVPVRTRDELESAADVLLAWTFRGDGPPIEGAVLRRGDAPYVFGPTSTMAKFKVYFELKVKVVAVDRTENGWVYTGALRGSDGQDVVLGRTFVSDEKLADVGDTLNVRVEELVVDDEGRISWGKPTPLGVDRTRPAYTVEQALDMAERSGTLKRYVVTKEEEYAVEVLDPPLTGYFSVFGNLGQIRDKLVPLIVKKGVRRIVEPFCGRGEAVWMVRAREHVLADIDPDVVRLHRICQNLTEADYERLRKFHWVGDHEHFLKLAEELEPEDDVTWFYRQLYCRRFGFRWPASKDFRHDENGTVMRWEPRVRKAQERLQGVVIEQSDFRETMKKYDEPGTLFFLDPPWPRQDKYYRFAGVSPADIAEAIRNLKHAHAFLVIAGSAEELAPLREIGLYERRILHEVPTRHFPGAFGANVQPRFYVRVFATYDLKALAKEGGEDDEPRSAVALRHWEERWHEAMPLSGEALPWVLHAHVRGLSGEEVERIVKGEWTLDDVVRQTDHSIHFDLRLATDRFDGWWGITLFGGSMEENREQLRPFQLMDDSDLAIQSSPKLFGPLSWLQVGVDKPFVVEPRGVGSTSRTWAAFWAVDRGTYRLGFARVHAVEIFLEGKVLKGRYLWQYAPLGEGRREWLLVRPADQTPYAVTHDRDEVIRELRQKGQRYLVWPKDPRDLRAGHELIDVAQILRIVRRDPEKRYTLAVAYPLREVDSWGDVITDPEQLEEAAWNYMRKSRRVGLDHAPGTEGAGTVVESYIYRGPRWEVNGEVVEPGDWLLGVVWTPQAWERIKRGEKVGLSIQGWAHRRKRREEV
jgi:site-specific DNA-adenine methylase